MFSRTFLRVNCKVTSKSTLTVQNITCQRSLHLACRNSKRDFVFYKSHKHQLRTPVLTATFIRHISDTTAKSENVAASNASQETVTQAAVDTSAAEEIISQIPEPPTVPVEELVEATAVVESLTSLGLGGWSPSGMVQQTLEVLHTSLDLPWWATIAGATMCVRLLLFPVVIKMQRSVAKMNNVQPQIQFIQTQLTEARKMGDHMEVARLSHELYSFMKEKGVNPIQNAALPMLQAPIFLSFFWGLRGMVQAPVSSMKDGGLWWFTDLTVQDPYYLLPLLTSGTLFLTIKMGTDVRLETLGVIKYVVKAMPIVIFPFIMNFEGAILCYWVSTNFFSLAQVSLLRMPKVRTYFNIPELIKHDPNKLMISKKKFVEGFKDSWTNMKVARELSHRQMYDETVFENAGKGPVPKTYKYDPTKKQPLTNAILARKKH